MNISRVLMTSLFALLIFLPLSVSGQKADRIIVTIGFTEKISGTRCGGARGFWFIIRYEREDKIKSADVSAEVVTIEGGKLRFDFLKPLPKIRKEKKRTEPITIFEDMALDAKTAAALGFKSITLKRGDYAVDYKFGKYGSTVFETSGTLD